MRSWALAGSDRTYQDVIETRLGLLSEAIGVTGPAVAPQLAAVGGLLGPWAAEPVESLARRGSFVANDGSPAEFSFSLAAGVAASRVLFEPEPPPGSPGIPGGDALAGRLAKAGYGVRRLRLIRDLFAGPASGQPFLMLYSAVLGGRAARPAVKLYLNPAAGGPPAATTAGAAMERLGLGAQWRGLVSRLRAEPGPSPSRPPCTARWNPTCRTTPPRPRSSPRRCGTSASVPAPSSRPSTSSAATTGHREPPQLGQLQVPGPTGRHGVRRTGRDTVMLRSVVIVGGTASWISATSAA